MYNKFVDFVDQNFGNKMADCYFKFCIMYAYAVMNKTLEFLVMHYCDQDLQFCGKYTQ